MNKFDRVIAYGCSWTAGDELCWEDLEKQKKLAWAGQIAKKLNLPIDNRAKSGNSLSGIISDILVDSGKGLINKKDLILIGITAENRLLHIDPHLWPIQVAWPENWPTVLQKHKNILISDVWTDHNMMFAWYTSLLNLIYISETKFNNQMMLFKCATRRAYKFPDDHLDASFMFKEFERLSEGKFFFHEKNLYDFVAENDVIHPNMHPGVTVHEKFASYVFDCIKVYL